MKTIALKALTILVAAGCTACSNSFYFAYAFDNIKGRVEISDKRIQDDQLLARAGQFLHGGDARRVSSVSISG